MTELDLAVERLVRRVSHWTPPRWAASSASGSGSRADMMHALVQRVADLAAVAEGQPQRPVPRLANNLALPDQLRVVARDLAATADQESMAAAVTLITAAFAKRS
jgi:hypothetical protein